MRFFLVSTALNWISMSSNFPSENETSLLHIIIEARRINEAEITIDLPRTTKKVRDRFN